MNEIKLEAKALFDKIIAWQQSVEKHDKNGYIYSGKSPESTPPDRALALAKEWVAKMDQDIVNNDIALAYFDMKCALYWLRYVGY